MRRLTVTLVLSTLLGCQLDGDMYRATGPDGKDYETFVSGREAFLAKYPRSELAYRAREEILYEAAVRGDLGVFERGLQPLEPQDRARALVIALGDAIVGPRVSRIREGQDFLQARVAFVRGVVKLGAKIDGDLGSGWERHLDRMGVEHPFVYAAARPMELSEAFDEHLLPALVESGADANHWLAKASEADRIEILRYLLARGADVNGGSGDRMPPLIAACRQNRAEAASVLLAHGADVQRRWKGETPLMVAVGLCGRTTRPSLMETLEGERPKPLPGPSVALVKALLKAGARVAGVPIPTATRSEGVTTVTVDGATVELRTGETSFECEEVARLLVEAARDKSR